MRDLLYFDAMITPKIITFIYWLLLAAIALGGLAMLGVGFSRGFGAGMASLLVVPIVVALWALMARIYGEVMIVLFKMNEALQDLRGR